MPAQGMNEYWIPNHDINKRVITKEIQCYLGPYATVRPYSFEVGVLRTEYAAISNMCLRAKRGF